jgi:hypothetical protein
MIFIPQGFCATWEETFGRGKGDVPRAMVPTDDGGYLLTGGSQGEQGTNAFRIWVLKTGSLGKIQWQKTFGFGIGESIVASDDGGFVIAATSQSSSDTESAIRIFKINKFGDLQWQRTIDRLGSADAPFQIQKASKGGYIVIAYTNFTGSRSSIWILRLNAQGIVKWQYTYGGATFDVPTQIKETSEGGWIVVGYTKLSGSKVIRCWLFKINSTGQIIWQKAFGGDRDTYGIAIVLTEDQTFAVSGWILRDTGWDLFVMKLDKDGNMIWQKIYGGPGSEEAMAFQATQNGFVLSGSTTSFIHGFNGNAFILALDSQGEIQWQSVYGDENHSYISSIQQTKDTGYIGLGSISQSGSGQDFWLLKVDHSGNLENSCDIQLDSQMIVEPGNLVVFQTERKPIARKFTIKTPDILITNTAGFLSSVCKK